MAGNSTSGVDSVLVLCIGNICRSPVAERLLQRQVPRLRVASAGLQAVTGSGADGTMTLVAAKAGLPMDGHVARQFSAEIAKGFDLILVMEQGHRQMIGRQWPALLGRTMLFGQWLGADLREVTDPYLKPEAVHQAVFKQLSSAADAWARRLAPAPERAE